jgi:enterochelin esterase-like enzyme
MVEVTREVEVIREVEVTAESAASGEITIPGTEVTTLHASVAGRDYQIFVALPPGYATSISKYPVVYLVDGNFHWIMTTEIARRLNLAGVVRDLIIVGIEASGPRPGQGIATIRGDSLEPAWGYLSALPR